MRILVIDDEPNLRRMLRAILEEEGLAVLEAGSVEAGWELLRETTPEVVLLDISLPGASGLDALPHFRSSLPGVPIIMMSGRASLADAAQAIRDGAFHFIEKPLTPAAVLATVRSALEVSRVRELQRALREELGPGTLLVGESPPITQLREAILRVGPTDARVLIVGESGTGKELAASAIHRLSRRAGAPFIRVNSAAIPRELVENELFGHERGAFTGADQRRLGRFELADRGTLFLDEVGDLGIEAQAKLLRVLEEGAIQRLGGRDTIRIDVRVLSATNRDLRSSSPGLPFREDLLFRLEVVPLRMPPLRARREDIPLLVEHLGERLRLREGLRIPVLTPSALEFLQEHPWPGNVRELINLLERLAILHRGETVDADGVRPLLGGGGSWGLLESNESIHQGGTLSDGPRGRGSLRERLERFERALISEALAQSHGNMAEAARRLQTDRANLYRRIQRLGLVAGS